MPKLRVNGEKNKTGGLVVVGFGARIGLWLKQMVWELADPAAMGGGGQSRYKSLERKRELGGSIEVAREENLR